MTNNEDYLDSLLKAAAEQDDPNSAINKVRELGKREAEERAQAEELEPSLDGIDFDSLTNPEQTADDSLIDNVESDDLFADLSPSEDVNLDGIDFESLSSEGILSEEAPVEDVPLEGILEEAPTEEVSLEGLLDETPTEEVSLEGLLEEAPPEEATIEEAAIEDIPVEESALEEVPAEEIPLEDVSLEEASIEEIPIEETTVEETPIEEIPLETIPEETLSEDAVESSETGEDASNLDSLLNSDFAGEVDLSDISNLLDDADSFANSEEGSASEETLLEETPLEGEGGEEALSDITFEGEGENYDNILGDLSGLIEPTDVEKMVDENAAEGLDMSESEITDLINDASDVSSEQPEGEVEIDLSDLSSLETEFGVHDKNDIVADETVESTEDSAELDEISDLLKSIDSNEVEQADDTDVLNLLNEAVTKQEEIENQAAMEKAREEAQAEYNEYKEKKAKEEEAKNKKSIFSFFKKKKDENAGEAPKKESKLSKILAFLTAEEEEPESEDDGLLNATDLNPEEGAKASSEGFEDVPGENKEILEEMDKEGEEEGGKKKKKKKKKKGKGDKGKEAEGEEGEEGEEGASKEKKPKKEKKERKPLVLDIDTGKPLSKRNVKLIGVLAATLLICILLICKFVPGMLINSSARKAYYVGDYETTYNTFFGEKLSQSDQILFDRSSIILKMLHKYDAYSAYMNMNMRVEALDQLLQGVSNYENWLFIAETTGATDEFNQAYTKVIGALSMTFGLTEEDAKAVISLPTDLEYSLMCESIANHTDYIDPTKPLPGPFIPPVTEDYVDPVYEDYLPEEGN